MHKKHSIIVVAGPTASGKSDFAVALAKEHNGEVISADSRQIYQELDLGTGKITEEEMGGIPHHMLSVYPLGDVASVARYREDAHKILEDIIARGKTPIICGGTGQYLDALMYEDSLPHIPPNKALREELTKKTSEELFTELERLDPRRANMIDRHNQVRLIRALEIVHAHGSVPKQEEPKFAYDVTFYLMNPTRETLRNRVIKRIEKRIALGMLEEVKHIHTKGYDHVTMKRFGIEYDIVGRYFDREYDLETAKIILSQKTMQYVKRQETWNKKYKDFAILVPVLE